MSAASAHRRSASRRDGAVLLVCLGVGLLTAAVSVVLRELVPVSVLPKSGYDDSLFIRQATSLSQGRWLGAFDDLTLSKGPAYPVFIATMHTLHVPLKVGEQLTQLAAALALAGCVWVLTRRPVVTTAAFVVVALDPTMFGFAASRVIRNSWYASLSLLLLATFFLAVYAAVTRIRLVWALALAVVSGVVLATFWLCREEGPAILPALAVIAVMVPLWALLRGRARRAPGPVRSGRARVKAARLVGVLALTGVAALAPIAYVMYENSTHYGAALTNDVAAGQYGRAYADWADVVAGPSRPFVPISTAQRAAVYAISPAASELAPVLESPGDHWRSASCRLARICDDYAGGWEVWAIREAASSAGHFTSEAAVQDYFGRVAHDIEAACSSGRLQCDAHLPPSLEPLQHATVGGILGSFWDGLVYTTTSSGPTTLPGPQPAVPHALRQAFADEIVRLPPTTSQAQAKEARLAAHSRPYRLLADVYHWLVLALLVTGVAGFALRFVSGRRFGPFRRGPRVVVLLGAGLAAGAFARLLLLAMLDSTTFAAAASSYQLATRSMLIGCALVGAAALADVVARTVTTARAGRSGRAGPADVDRPSEPEVTQPV